MDKSRITIGTRGSPLALTQTGGVARRIQERFPALRIETKIIKTLSDRSQDRPLGDLGGKGLFIKEIEDALLSGEVDLGVHSLKDMTAETTRGLEILAVTSREDARDCLVSKGRSLKELPSGAVVGTSSLRRLLLAHSLRPDLRYEPIRGNVDTRIRKVDEGRYDAVILAYAALKRLGLEARSVETFSPDVFVPAGGQGSLSIEGRVDDQDSREWAAVVGDADAHACWRAEQAFLQKIEGGCRVPVGAYATLSHGILTLNTVKGTEPGRPLIRAGSSGPAHQAIDIGRRLAEDVLRREAADR